MKKVTLTNGFDKSLILELTGDKIDIIKVDEKMFNDLPEDYVLDKIVCMKNFVFFNNGYYQYYVDEDILYISHDQHESLDLFKAARFLFSDRKPI